MLAADVFCPRVAGSLPDIVETVLSAAAPVGRLIVPEMFPMFQVPDCAAWTANVPVPTTVALRLAAVACATVKFPVPAFAVTVPVTGRGLVADASTALPSTPQDTFTRGYCTPAISSVAIVVPEPWVT